VNGAAIGRSPRFFPRLGTITASLPGS
jgi:hypothetical protein